MKPYKMDVTKEPIIGIIKTEPLIVFVNGVETTFPGKEYQVVEVIEHKGQKIYVVNQWYKPGVPQLIHEGMVYEWIAH